MKVHVSQRTVFSLHLSHRCDCHGHCSFLVVPLFSLHQQGDRLGWPLDSIRSIRVLAFTCSNSFSDYCRHHVTLVVCTQPNRASSPFIGGGCRHGKGHVNVVWRSASPTVSTLFLDRMPKRLAKIIESLFITFLSSFRDIALA